MHNLFSLGSFPLLLLSFPWKWESILILQLPLKCRTGISPIYCFNVGAYCIRPINVEARRCRVFLFQLSRKAIATIPAFSLLNTKYWRLTTILTGRPDDWPTGTLVNLFLINWSIEELVNRQIKKFIKFFTPV